MPIATGIKVANPNLKVLALGGDGDAFAIGGGHFIHAARRNLDVCYVIMDNAIYGLTKGQTSPTSMVGFVTKTTPNGTPDRPVNPLQLAMASGATFVARAFSGKPKELADLIVQGIDHKGFAIIDAYSPCPTFNKVNTFKYYRDQAHGAAEGPRRDRRDAGLGPRPVDGPGVSGRAVPGRRRVELRGPHRIGAHGHGSERARSYRRDSGEIFVEVRNQNSEFS